MKTPLFIFIVCFSTLSLSSAQPPVRDTDGNILRSGRTGYYIMPTTRGLGGGIKLAPTSINETCPSDVVQENNDLQNGLPLTFTPVKANKDGAVVESTDLNIRFSGASDCVQAIWRVEVANGQREISSHGSLGNPGPQTISNWFKIEKLEDSYKLVFCPTVCNTCRPACADIGHMIAKSGRISLVLNNVPLKVMFKKA